MPAVLSDRQICHDHVPLEWETLLESLAAFMDCETQLRERPGDAALISQINALHDHLVDQSETLLEPHVFSDDDQPFVERVFAKSVLLLIHLAQAMVGDDELLDTAGCRTLQLYAADFLAKPGNQDLLRKALRDTTSLESAELDRLVQEVDLEVQQAEQKHRVVRAIREHFGLWESADDLKQNIFRFFQAMYPNAGIIAEEVELIATGTMIFFCLPFRGDELTTERFQALGPEQQDAIRSFFGRVNRFSQWQFAHFPVFGFRRGRDLPRDLLNELASRSGLTVEQVAEELSTLTAIVPLDEMDKYVVHDLWGHSWQAALLRFDDRYVQLARFADPIHLDERADLAVAQDGDGEYGRAFEACFVGTGDELRLDESQFLRYVNLEVAERLPIAVTPVLAEVLADVAEFKLLAENTLERLESSSVLDRFPAKLDLTMRDVGFYFRQATKVFRLWASRAERLQATVKQLVERGGSVAAAEAAVARAAEIWRDLERDWFSESMTFRRDGDTLRVNVVARLALNFLAIHRETLRTYQLMASISTAHLPIKGFRDLMLISVAVFFDQDPSRNLWRVDEFLSLKIEPLCRRLANRSSTRRH